MSKSQLAHSNRSVSDGDLVGDERKKAKNIHDTSIISESIDKQVFFTLPRWMSGRKKRNKIKYIKVDVPFTSYDPRNTRVSKSHDGEKKPEKSGSFIRKLFRSNSFFSSARSSQSSRTIPRVPTSPFISSSNSDVHRTSANNFKPLDYQECFKDKCPSVCGIRNHGNTCFMNAVIQCLSNTDFFAEYFVMGHYKTDLKRNRTHSKRFGTRGEVTEQLGGLLKALWSCQYYPSLSTKFKNTVAKYGAQYEGNDQHDAQEFLLWLLDKVHEDLNTAPKETYKRARGNIGRSDEDIAAEMLANHLRCNNSFIHGLFQGQIRSSLCCLGCGKFSNTFDPYLCVSLPIPSSFNISVYVHVIHLKEKMKMVKVGVSIDAQASVSDLREKLNLNFKLPKDNVLLLEILDGQYQRTFSDCDLVANLKDSEGLYALEVPCKDKKACIEIEKILLVLMNVVETETGSKMFWRPFVLDICREVNFKDLEKEFLSAIKHIIPDDYDVGMNDFSFCISDEESGNETISSSVDMPLYMPVIDKALLLCLGDIPHMKLTVKWKQEVKNRFRTNVSFCDVHHSVEELENAKKPSDEATLYECFDLYFNEERLGNEDAWRCPHCAKRLPCVKTLSLWSTPDVLIVHLKRFRQSSSERTKITKFVEFPSSGLDLNSYVTTRNQNSQQVQSNTLASMTFWSPWKRSRCRPYSRIEDNLYELYAVCNHHGSMQGGHYTAYCKNPINSHWYLYDDIKVQEVEASAVISSDAYILFYQRSSLVSHSCASSSSSGYSSASSTLGPEHWAFHLSAFFKNATFNGKSQDTLFDIGKTSSLDRRISSSIRSFDRSSRAYSTMMPPSVTKSNSMKFDAVEEKKRSDDKPYEEIEIPPPPPPAKHYWTVTSV